MEVLVLKIFPSLLFISLMMFCVVSERLQMESENDNKNRTPGTKNNTHEDCNQDVTGSRKCSVYVLNDPYKQCYTQFFVREQPPVGLRTGNLNLRDIRYICQPPAPTDQLPHQTYYATMFDERRGIAVFSAYILDQWNVNFPGGQNSHSWNPTPGIRRQGSDDLYRGAGYERGHLVPAHTFSNDRQRYISTYTYTNAVPQRGGFNRGSWKTFENRIRRYATVCTQAQGQQPGTLYLLTGTSFLRIQPDNAPQPPYHPQVIAAPLNWLPHMLGIAIPNSMWTAGCCVRPNNQNTRSFAVIGNNVQNPQLTLQVTVAHLQNILAADVNQHMNIGAPNVDLFPGNPNCLIDLAQDLRHIAQPAG